MDSLLEQNIYHSIYNDKMNLKMLTQHPRMDIVKSIYQISISLPRASCLLSTVRSIKKTRKPKQITK